VRGVPVYDRGEMRKFWEQNMINHKGNIYLKLNPHISYYSYAFTSSYSVSPDVKI
jgi:hypothetical protein